MLIFIIPVPQNFKWRRPCPSQSFSFSKYFGTRLQERIMLQEEQVVWESRVLSSGQICLWFVVWSQASYWVPGTGGSWTPTSPAGSGESIVWYLEPKILDRLDSLMSIMKRCDFSYLPAWGIVPLHYIHMALSDVGTVKETTVTPLCSSQCWCSTKPWLWGIAQIFLYNPPGTSASWSLIFDRAGFLQASWLVIYVAFFVVILIFPYSHCLLMSWFEVTSCS